MKIPRTKQSRWIAIALLLVMSVTPAFALFGIGDIVFDPTSYASLVSQATTALNQLRLIENNIAHFSFKQQWQTSLASLRNANVSNTFGETSGMSTALNSDAPGASATAWQAATLPVNTAATSLLAGQTVGSSAQLSELALIEMTDAISPDCLTAVGQYRASRTTNAPASSSLAANQFDAGAGTNSEVQQLNLLNAASAQRLTEAQSQGTLAVCLASQMTVASMQQRNAVAQDLNTAGFVVQQRSVNDTSAAHESNTWQSYLP